MLELDLVTVLLEAVNFLIFAGVLYFLLWRPVMARIRERARRQEQAMEQLADDQAAAAELHEELASRLASAEDEADAIISRAKNQADVERAALLQEAQAEVERILTEAHMDSYRLKRQAIEEFHEELLEAVLSVSGLVIGRVAPDELHDTMVRELCDSVWEMGQSDMRRVDVLRRSLGERTPTVVARTAQALTPEQRGLVVRTFSALADRNVNLDVKIEPALGLGMQVRVGDLVMDNTIAGRLEELQSTVAGALEERVASD